MVDPRVPPYELQRLPEKAVEYLNALAGMSEFMDKALPWVWEFLNSVADRWPNLVELPIMSIGVNDDASCIGCNFDTITMHVEVEFSESEGNTVYFSGRGFNEVVEFNDPLAAMMVATGVLETLKGKRL